MEFRRVVVAHFGNEEVLQVIEDDLPVPQAGEVRVKILVAGVAWGDILKRQGWGGRDLKPPFTPGYDLVGIVDQLGEGVTTLHVGQIVAALSMVGGYAEFICLPDSKLVPVPIGIDPAQAVCLIMNYVVAYQLLHRVACVKPGESILVHSAAGGIGTALLDLGKLLDLKVYGTASAIKQSAITDLGGIPMDYKSENVVSRIRYLTKEGVDAVFDPIGGAHLWQSYRSLNKLGRLIQYGVHTLAKGKPFDLLSGLLIGSVLKRLPDQKQVISYNLATAPYSSAASCHEDLITLFHLLAEEKIRPIISHRIPLVEAAKAHKLLATGLATGKIILVCNSYT